MKVNEVLVSKLLPIAYNAGAAILAIYHSGQSLEVQVKDDHSPLTVADKESNQIITNGLKELFPSVPVLSEEGVAVPYEIRKEWNYYWCVDPLDGTKEFIYRRDDFTVNIALMHINRPLLGIIYAPAYDVIYYGSYETGGWSKRGNGEWKRLYAAGNVKEWTAIGSRSHASIEESGLLKSYPVVRNIAAGSSLKFCRIAEGAAHIYYRHGPTMEWDTAAGQAIAESSGAVMTAADGSEFLYNKPALKNGSFVCKVEM